jgi:hypothetical protein
MRDTPGMDTVTAAPAERPEIERPERDFRPFLAVVADAPPEGTVARIVLRPGEELRREVEEAVLDVAEGVVGDDWRARGSSRTPDGSANRGSQVTLMSTRVLAAIEPDEARWVLAGDQLLADMDLSVERLPTGARLAVGEAVLVVSEDPHTGCAKFSARFGSDALRWINGPDGRALRMRGVNLTVERGGVVRVGDPIRRL